MVRLNRSYKFRNDRHRALIFDRKFHGSDPCIPEWISRVHPVYVMLLSLYERPMEIEEAYKACQEFLDTDLTNAQKLIDSFLNEDKVFSTVINGETSFFPPHLLLQDQDKDRDTVKAEYKPEQFIYTPPVDLNTTRLFEAPLGLVWVVTDRCVTDCVYCYAQKNKADKWMDMSQVERFLKDAKRHGIRDIFLSGGELFLHPQWKEILALLYDNGYWPGMISTKMPITEDIVNTLLKYPPVLIQVSLDSVDKERLKSTLRVDEAYIDNVKYGLSLLDKHKIPLQIATVLTKETASIHNIEELASYISRLECLDRWTIRVGFSSLYSHTPYYLWRVDEQFRKELQAWVEEAADKSNYPITLDLGKSKLNNKSATGSKDFPGASCSANITHAVVLPDGKVTICEQLYWNPRFIIGDVKEQSISDIWRGAKAIGLADIPQNSIQTKSPCSTCELYDSCLKFPNKCYPDVIKAYGDENWDFPDLRCERAPEHLYDIDN